MHTFKNMLILTVAASLTQFNFDYNVFNCGAKFVMPGVIIPEQKFSSSAAAALCVKHGRTATEGKNYSLAIQFFERALGFEPNNDTAKKDLSNAYNALAAYELKANPSLAMETFKKAKQYWQENPMTPDTLEQAQKLYGQSLSAGNAGGRGESPAALQSPRNSERH